MIEEIRSWGRAHEFKHSVSNLSSRCNITKHLAESLEGNKSALPFGMGRSYGDSNLNKDGLLLKTSLMKAFIEADWRNGLIKVQAGLTLDEFLNVAVPKGWFLPVTPGTKFVTVGGAIANNVHGKNHHKVGSFGNFVTSLCLHRSDRKGKPLICSPTRNKKWFELKIVI